MFVMVLRASYLLPMTRIRDGHVTDDFFDKIDAKLGEQKTATLFLAITVAAIVIFWL